MSSNLNLQLSRLFVKTTTFANTSEDAWNYAYLEITPQSAEGVEMTDKKTVLVCNSPEDKELRPKGKEVTAVKLPWSEGMTYQCEFGLLSPTNDIAKALIKFLKDTAGVLGGTIGVLGGYAVDAMELNKDKHRSLHEFEVGGFGEGVDQLKKIQLQTSRKLTNYDVINGKWLNPGEQYVSPGDEIGYLELTATWGPLEFDKTPGRKVLRLPQAIMNNMVVKLLTGISDDQSASLKPMLILGLNTFFAEVGSHLPDEVVDFLADENNQEKLELAYQFAGGDRDKAIEKIKEKVEKWLGDRVVKPNLGSIFDSDEVSKYLTERFFDFLETKLTQ